MNFKCNYRNEKWEGTISGLRAINGCARFNVTARGSSIDVMAGKIEEVGWIVFPNLGKGCTIVSPADVQWNSEAIGDALNSIVDGVSVAVALYHAVYHLEGLDTDAGVGEDDDYIWHNGREWLTGVKAYDYVKFENIYWEKELEVIQELIDTMVVLSRRERDYEMYNFTCMVENVQTIKNILDELLALSTKLQDKILEAFEK